MPSPALLRRPAAPRATIIKSLLTALGLCLALSVQAETVLDLTFDDPKGLIKSKPEGISKVTSEFNGSKTTIASGSGGRALPQTNEGPAAEQEGKPSSVKIQILSEPAMGTPAFLHLALDANSVTRSVGAGIIPDSAASALSSLVTYEDGHAIINGGLDFFFRATSDGGSSPRLGLWAKCGGLGFDLATDPEAQGLMLRLYTKKKSIHVEGDKIADKAGLNAKSTKGISIAPGEIYHAAIAFQTAPDGTITVDILLQAGAGPMKIEHASVLTLGGFRLLAEDHPSGADKVSISLGQSQSPQTLDLAQFRIFKPLPKAFPGIDGKE